MNPKKALLEAVRIVGSQSELARRCGIRQPAVAQWIASGRVPAERAIEVERMTQAQVTRYDLRPDLYPRE